MTSPDLLYLLHADPADLREALQGMRAADIAESLRALRTEPAAKVLAALPFDVAVQVFDEPELTHQRASIVRRMQPEGAGALTEATWSDQQADLVRELPEPQRSRIIKTLDADTQRALSILL